MLHTISNQELEHLLTLDHPTWTPQAIAQQAEEYRNFLDDRLDAPLRRYLDTGKPQQFRVGEFSLLLIQAMRRQVQLPSGRPPHGRLPEGPPQRQGADPTAVIL